MAVVVVDPAADGKFLSVDPDRRQTFTLMIDSQLETLQAPAIGAGLAECDPLDRRHSRYVLVDEVVRINVTPAKIVPTVVQPSHVVLVEAHQHVLVSSGFVHVTGFDPHLKPIDPLGFIGTRDTNGRRLVPSDGVVAEVGVVRGEVRGAPFARLVDEKRRAVAADKPNRRDGVIPNLVRRQVS
jgi:hypothetical protein